MGQALCNQTAQSASEDMETYSTDGKTKKVCLEDFDLSKVKPLPFQN